MLKKKNHCVHRVRLSRVKKTLLFCFETIMMVTYCMFMITVTMFFNTSGIQVFSQSEEKLFVLKKYRRDKRPLNERIKIGVLKFIA